MHMCLYLILNIGARHSYGACSELKSFVWDRLLLIDDLLNTIPVSCFIVFFESLSPLFDKTSFLIFLLCFGVPPNHFAKFKEVFKVKLTVFVIFNWSKILDSFQASTVFILLRFLSFFNWNFFWFADHLINDSCWCKKYNCTNDAIHYLFIFHYSYYN